MNKETPKEKLFSKWYMNSPFKLPLAIEWFEDTKGNIIVFSEDNKIQIFEIKYNSVSLDGKIISDSNNNEWGFKLIYSSI